MDYQRFYAKLFAPLEAKLGALDPNTIFHFMGFDGGGPLNFCTIGLRRGSPLSTYVSCELSPRDEQQPSELGRYELLCTCADEEWVESVLSDLGRMSLHVTLGHGHTVDIGVSVGSKARLQGALLQTECRASIDRKRFAIFRVIGITRPEMEFAQSRGSAKLISALKKAGVYPNTVTRRKSVV